MRSCGLVVILCLGTIQGVAQGTSRQYDILTREAEGGKLILQLVNKSTADISAFRLTISCPSYEMTYIDDNATKGIAPHLVSPNAPYTLRTNGVISGCIVRDSAVRFIDGQVAGTAAGLVALQEERDGARDELASSRPFLSKVATGEVNQEGLQKYLASRRKDIVSGQQLSKASVEGHAIVLTELEHRLLQKPKNEAMVSTRAAKGGLSEALPLNGVLGDASSSNEGIQARARSVAGEIDYWLGRLAAVR